jgi:hypothetical protein
MRSDGLGRIRPLRVGEVSSLGFASFDWSGAGFCAARSAALLSFSSRTSRSNLRHTVRNADSPQRARAMRCYPDGTPRTPRHLTRRRGNAHMS